MNNLLSMSQLPISDAPTANRSARHLPVLLNMTGTANRAGWQGRVS